MAEILRLPLRFVGRQTHHPILAVAAVLVGPYMVSFHSRLFGLGLTDLKAAFGLSFDEGAWLNTFANAPQLFVAPAVGWLVATFGIRRVLVPAALLYALTSALIPTTTGFAALVALHVVNGLLLGIFVPATLMIILRNLPMKWWITGIALYAFRTAFTANAGTALVDIYVQHVGWQFLYWQDVFLAPLLALLAWLGAPSEKVNRDMLERADWGGMLLFGAGLTMLFVAIDQGNRLDWFENGLVTTTFIGGITLMLAFFINEMLVEAPWAHVRAISARNVMLVLSVALFYMMASASNTALVPNYLSAVAHLRPEQIGTVLLQWVCIPLVLLTPIGVWAMHRTDGRLILAIGLFCFGLASYLGTGLTPEWNGDSFRTILVLQAAGHILTFLPIVVLAVANGNPKNAIATGAYIQVLRLLAVQVAQSLVTTYIRKGEQTQSYLLGINVERGSQTSTTTLSALSHKVAGAGEALAQSRATSLLSQQVQNQATVLAYIDAFWLTLLCAVGGLIILAFVSKAPKGPLTS
ncbi:MAG: MFS transporter [Neorhizobium sp.]|nr:MFS transporter [Neorhizobium sp.]